ncbi:MAG: chemotaxis protein CheX [Firmicutes bacterium]|jgi:chemotaxis protein CheX|nr:chemotaxis protein CheX [Bacillota bacterium]
MSTIEGRLDERIASIVAAVRKGGPGVIKAAFVNPFIYAGSEVLSHELKVEVQRGPLTLEASNATSSDVTIMLGVTGDPCGIVLYGMSEATAKGVLGSMMGERIPIFDEMAESALAELGNLITGLASVHLEKSGYLCRLTPPTVITGKGVIISTVNISRIVVPLLTPKGEIYISLCLRSLR